MILDDKTWQIIRNNQRTLDGQVWYAIKSTRIFCKPSCPSRLPRIENVVLYTDPKQAMVDGYRPCKRCRPTENMVPNEIWVDEINYIMKTYYAEKLPLKELAHRVHGSASYLRHTYKEATGITPQQKLTMIRMEKAEQSLLSGNRSIAAIGNNVGIPNTAYFIKLFKEQYGRTPLQYRLDHTQFKQRHHQTFS